MGRKRPGGVLQRNDFRKKMLWAATLLWSYRMPEPPRQVTVQCKHQHVDCSPVLLGKKSSENEDSLQDCFFFFFFNGGFVCLFLLCLNK